MYEWRIRCTLSAEGWTTGDVHALAVATGGEAEHIESAGSILLTARVRAHSIGGATQQVNRTVGQALREIGRGGRVVSLLAESPELMPAGARADLSGTKEAGAILGVTAPRVKELSQQPAFPVPLAVLASGPVWDSGELRQYAETRSRRGGRPRKASSDGESGRPAHAGPAS
jgi:hypothetical protein